MISEFCVYVDPIDNTKGFINGTLDCVTILIGLTRNKRAYIGITALPFLKDKGQIVYKPEVLLGIVPVFKAFSSFESNKWVPMEKPKLNTPIRIVSRDRGKITSSLNNAVKGSNASLHFNGGSGKKISQVAKG